MPIFFPRLGFRQAFFFCAVTFTTKEETDEATATLETAQASEEESEFLNYDEVRKIDSRLFDHTDNGTTHNSVRLMGGNSTEVYGLARSISVMPGDRINAEVHVKYLDPEPANWSTWLLDALASLTGVPDPEGTFVDGGAVGNIDGVFPFEGMLVRDGDNGTGPKAYLNYLYFDRNYEFITGGFRRVSTAAREDGAGEDEVEGIDHERLFFENISITEPGYVYIYLSNENESPVEVFFDDFSVEHIKSPVVQVDDYYPFGLTFNSYQRDNSVDQRWKFQGQEHLDDLGLNWDSFKWRNHQPDIGRFFNVDPLANEYVYNSPYAFSENHVTSHIELEGLEKLSIKNIDNSPGIIQGPWANVATALAYGTTNTTPEGFIRSSTMRQSRVTKLEKGNFKGHPEGIVLHRTVNSSTDETIDVFNSRGFGTHFVVGPDGEVTQTASLDRWTQHVGKPKAGNPGKRSSNTVGIEVVGNYDYATEKWDPLTEEQVMSVSNLVNTLYKMYGLSYSDVYGHEDLSAKNARRGCGRKGGN